VRRGNPKTKSTKRYKERGGASWNYRKPFEKKREMSDNRLSIGRRSVGMLVVRSLLASEEKRKTSKSCSALQGKKSHPNGGQGLRKYI